MTSLQELVDAGVIAGAATLRFRTGTEPVVSCAGWRDVEARLPIARDTIFRIASLSKPITSAAALTLLDEGGIGLGDPIARWAPEFAHMRVLRNPAGTLDDAALTDTVPAERAITIRDLLTHRAGLTYGAFWPGPLGDAYRRALGDDIDSALSPDDWIARLATLPLIDQPGHTLHYGHSIDLLGLLVARIDGAPLGEVLARRIFRPLGMRDTGFIVPQADRHRRAAAYGVDDRGRLKKLTQGHDNAFLAERPGDMTFEGGGAGLWSTLDDYLAFARMLLGGGAVDGVRLLRPETAALITTNGLTPAQRATAEMARLPLFTSGHGFGMGVAVVMEPEHAEPLVCGGGNGAFGWPGAFGSWWRADPNGGSIRIFLSHNMVTREQFARGIGMAMYAAIDEFARAA